ncbi:5-formyltetrahydrofolate cyclo-ligase [Arthrobacter sp. JSM 101049]|uniref:5-formyltetrahydrofolate cyclo-ligase n=1 Tax=Arthrobacter sp. JSM 101049 TaxID=929097 RepID=UPI00356627D2
MSKAAARTHFRTLRRQLDPARRRREMDAITAALFEWLGHDGGVRALTCVISYGAEPPTDCLLAELHRRGHRVLVPICEPERRLSWADWYPGVPMARATVAPIDEPVGERHPVSVMEEVDVVLVPAQAVDAAGGRLGQGGGYYDRFIASLRAMERRPVLLAMVFEHELVPVGTFEVGPLDQPVDGVVTAAGISWTTEALKR